ncbi:uncharacterized protein LOC120354814 [Nilaparvata lugens]|uniref:uncharacterized protein LOC120354814 n=1 Tax=Nilaparvata lugens TaxID=108931 RepID=UPI00193E2DEF|nr:uncharacterized protein LOC120354814 [Nilaparvata lugens]
MDALFRSMFVDFDSFDILGELPNEIGSMILRYLDGESLLKAANVSKRWNSLCRGDKKLRQRGRQQLRMMKKRKKEQIYGILKRSSYVPVEEVAAFKSVTSRNSNSNVQMNHKVIEYGALTSTLAINENILQKLKVNFGVESTGSAKLQKPKKSLSTQQKRRLLRH